MLLATPRATHRKITTSLRSTKRKQRKSRKRRHPDANQTHGQGVPKKKHKSSKTIKQYTPQFRIEILFKLSGVDLDDPKQQHKFDAIIHQEFTKFYQLLPTVGRFARRLEICFDSLLIDHGL